MKDRGVGLDEGEQVRGHGRAHEIQVIAESVVQAPDPGSHYEAVEVEGCAGPPREDGFNAADFEMAMADNTRAPFT